MSAPLGARNPVPEHHEQSTSDISFKAQGVLVRGEVTVSSLRLRLGQALGADPERMSPKMKKRATEGYAISGRSVTVIAPALGAGDSRFDSGRPDNGRSVMKKRIVRLFVMLFL